MTEVFECPVCLEVGGVQYRIGCKSKIDHTICNTCETTMRMKVTPTKNGRKIKCPMCRDVETVIGVRTDASWRAELDAVYKSLNVKNRRGNAERMRLLEEENAAFRLLMDQLVFTQPVVADEATIDVVTQDMVEVASLEVVEVASHEFPDVQEEVAVPPAPEEVAVPVAPRRVRRLCESGWRAFGACLTVSPTTRKCSWPGCEKRVCVACRECRSHLM